LIVQHELKKLLPQVPLRLIVCEITQLNFVIQSLLNAISNRQWAMDNKQRCKMQNIKINNNLEERTLNTNTASFYTFLN